jgi:tripartite ATP-independent transporter DctM subunit
VVRAGRLIDFSVTLALVCALIAELFVMLTNLVIRTVHGTSLEWSLEVAHLSLSVLTFVGGAFAYRRGHHVTVQFVVSLFPTQGQALVHALSDLLVMAVGALLAWYSIPLLLEGWTEQTPVLRISITWGLLPVTVGAGLVVFYAVDKLRGYSLRTLLWALAAATVVGIVGGVALTVFTITGALVPTILILTFLSCVLLGVPIAFSLLASAFIFVFIGTGVPPTIVIRQMVDGIDSFLLLAIPFFVFAGLVMVYGGLGNRISRSVGSILGHTRGGALQTVIVSMFLFSGLSGSKLADMAVVGGTLQEVAVSQGYSRGETAAVLTASAVMGETIPPSIVMLVMGSLTSLSVATLFIAGIVPAALLAVCLMLVVYWRAYGSKMVPTGRFTWKQAGIDLWSAAAPLGLPLFLIVGIVFGWATATEISSLAVIYGVGLSAVYRELTVKALWTAMQETVSLSGMVLLLISAATAFSWPLTFIGVPREIGDLVVRAGSNQLLFFGGSIIALIALGSLLEGLPALIVFVPILMPTAGALHINLVQYAIVMIIAMSLGVFAPPIGMGVYVTAALLKLRLEDIVRPLAPYWIVLFIGLLLVAAVPDFSLALPRLLHLSGAR